MTTKFRPQLLALEARDVPAAFSFQLADGSTGHGTFATPEGVDAAQAWQQLEVNDLAVTLSSTEYTVAPVPFAYYANGVLVGVVANTFSGADQLDLTLSGAQLNGGSTAPIAYDAADTQYNFQFSNGVGGTISFTFDWSQVDPTLSSQALTPTAFNVNIAGQNYAYGTANYTTAPTILFANGDLVGVSFAVNMAAGSPLLSVSVGNGIATGIDAITNLPLNSPVAAKGPATLTLDFSTITIPTTGSKKIKLTVYATGNVVKEVEVEIFPGATTATVTATMKAALEGAGFTVSAVGTTQLTISGTATSELTKIVADGDATKRPKLVGRAANEQGTYPEFDY